VAMARRREFPGAQPHEGRAMGVASSASRRPRQTTQDFARARSTSRTAHRHQEAAPGLAKPVWLVGTSRGVSAAAAAIALDPASIAGSARRRHQRGNPPRCPTSRAGRHSRADARDAPPARPVPFVRATQAPQSSRGSRAGEKLILVEGGGGAGSGPCGRCYQLHRHGRRRWRRCRMDRDPVP
jgi:hypothetical protein